MGNSRRDFYKAVREELEEKQRYVDAANAYQQARTKKANKGLVYYGEMKRKEIYNQAKSLGFSAQDLEKMAYYLEPEHWNQDEIYHSVGDQIVDAIELFYKAEQYLNTNAQKKTLGEKLFDAIAFLGDHMYKEDETNDN